MVTYGGPTQPEALRNAPRNGVGSRNAFHGLGLFRMRVGVQASRIPAGNTLADIKQNYERQRDGEFESQFVPNIRSAKAKFSDRSV